MKEINPRLSLSISFPLLTRLNAKPSAKAIFSLFNIAFIFRFFHSAQKLDQSATRRGEQGRDRLRFGPDPRGRRTHCGAKTLPSITRCNARQNDSILYSNTNRGLLMSAIFSVQAALNILLPCKLSKIHPKHLFHGLLTSPEHSPACTLYDNNVSPLRVADFHSNLQCYGNLIILTAIPADCGEFPGYRMSSGSGCLTCGLGRQSDAIG